MRIFDLMHREMTLQQFEEVMDVLGYYMNYINLKEKKAVCNSEEKEQLQMYFDIECSKIKINYLEVEL